MKIKLFAFVIFFLWAVPCFAGYVDTAWVSRYNGSANTGDEAHAIAVDSSGNVYVTGWSGGIGSGKDYVTIKYYPNGDTAWIRTYNGPLNDEDKAQAVAVDDSGYVYVTGYSRDISGWPDYITIKYYPDGDTGWVRRYSGPINYFENAYALTVDDSGYVYVTGHDDDNGTDYYATIKYKSNGDTAWVRRHVQGTGGSYAWGITVDDSGYIYVTGHQGGPPSTYDYATVKYHPNGDTVWLRRYNGPGDTTDVAQSIAVDDSENVYVTGKSIGTEGDYDFATIKYKPNGDTAWIRRYDGPHSGPTDDQDEPYAVIVDGCQNVYVTGHSGPYAGYDWVTIKYNSNGDTVWLRTYDGNWDDDARAIAVDDSGNVYVTGSSWRPGTLWDYLTIKYDVSGNICWMITYDGGINAGDYAQAIAVSGSDNVVVTGVSWGSDFDYTTISYIQYDSIPFAPAVNYLTGDGPSSVFCADLDKDLDLDLAIANLASNKVSILKNYGNGTFQNKIDYDVGGGPIFAFCVDLDGDGDLDLATSNHLTSNVSILTNNGDGTFQDTVNYPTGSGPRILFCADLDEDGDVDIATPNWDANSVSVLKNRGDATLETKVDYPAGNHPHAIFCADLDGDGDLDMVVANEYGDNVSICKNKGDGTFEAGVDYTVINHPRTLFCCDMDADSKLDLVAANFNVDSISILKNDGNGVFQPAVNYKTGDGPSGIFCSDLDGDSRPDVTTANVYGSNISILKNNGNGSLQNPLNYGTMSSPGAVFCADLDGDGDFDLAVTNYDSDTTSILKNLTQVNANQSPWSFSLTSPTNSDTVFGTTTFRWHIPYDPNFGDQFKYDLYISTSPGFEPLYTTVDSNLWVSKFTTVLDSGTYYWKVKAKDNWGAETWSSQTWSFESAYLGDTLTIIAFSPVDLIVTDPVGDSISPWFNTIYHASYDTLTDWNLDGDKDDIVTIPDRLVGAYIIRVVAEPYDSGTYNLGIRIDGSAMNLIIMNAPSPPSNGSDTVNYYSPSFKFGDANRDGTVDVGDVVFSINYIFRFGLPPDPIKAGDANCDDKVDVGDIVYLINYLFRNGPPPITC